MVGLVGGRVSYRVLLDRYVVDVLDRALFAVGRLYFYRGFG